MNKTDDKVNLYYKAPSQKIFDEVKAKSIEIWKTYSDEFGYQSEKVNRIKDLENISDNVLTMVAMFDHFNQAILSKKLSPEARKALADRLTAGGNPDFFNPFIMHK
jgi:hypothetical protein